MSFQSKKTIIGVVMGISLLAVCLCAQKETAAAPLIPVDVFCKNPESYDFKLSPDGDYLAYLKPWENRFNLYVKKIGQEDEIRLTYNSRQSIKQYEWVNDERLIYLFDSDGDENLKLYSVNRDGSQTRVLSSFDTSNVSIISLLESDPDEILIGIGKKAYRLQDAYRINVYSGKRTLVAENDEGIEFWLADHAGKVRVGTSTEDGGRRTIYYRATEKDKFKKLFATEPGETTQPLMFTFDDQNLYVKSNRLEDTLGLYLFNIAKAEIGDKLFSHPEVDLLGGYLSKKRKVIADSVYHTDRYHRHYFDSQWEQMLSRLEKLLPGMFVNIASQDKDETGFVLRTFNDRSAGSYYFYDSKTDRLLKICDICPWLKAEFMAEMKPIQFLSRDGLTIHGYLTVPPGVNPVRLPLLVMPHGGPWIQDMWGFNPEVQFFVNRGYAVLQINFRGSSGYGRKFLERGFKQWGQGMQNDISDGVLWLIKEGIADPKRIGIFGASYGGYAALAGVAFTPDLYACAVDYIGISDLVAFTKSSTFVHPRVGHPEKDRKMLEEFSPCNHVQNIKAPLFIAQGANDPRVARAQSEKMVSMLKKRGVKVVYMVKENEGHGFSKIENRIDFYSAVETFLSEHLGGRKTGD